jgi:hypothetical protein
MAPRPIAGLVRRGPTTTKWPRESENSGINHPRGDLKDIFTGDSNSGDDSDRRKKLYVMYGGS